jgi:hypothetical protein
LTLLVDFITGFLDPSTFRAWPKLIYDSYKSLEELKGRSHRAGTLRWQRVDESFVFGFRLVMLTSVGVAPASRLADFAIIEPFHFHPLDTLELPGYNSTEVPHLP